MTRHTFALLPLPGTALALAALATACAASPTADDDAATADVTYWRDIAPIYERHCTGCHTDGAIAPFALDDYESARATATVAAHETAERAMPPFAADNTGDCGSYREARWLSDEEIDLVDRWAMAGAPEGDPAEAPPTDPPVPVALEGHVIERAMAEPFTPTAGADQYRCFDVPLDFESDAFVTGFDLTPGNPAIVHHVIVWAYDPAAVGFTGLDNATSIAEMDERDEGPGWDCLGLAGGVVTDALPAIWSPGAATTRFPDHTGLRLRPQQRLIFEVHYSPGNAPTPDRSTVRLEIADAVENEAELVLIDPMLVEAVLGTPFVMPPGEPSVSYTWTADLATLTTPPGPPAPDLPPPAAAIDVYGVLPHMHAMGTSLHAEVVRGDTSTCATDVPRWDYHWQQLYWYDEPLRLDQTQQMRVTCDWDTRGRDTPTMPGFSSTDEMCALGLFFVRRDP